MSQRRAKIVATLGPSSNTVEVISELINEGLNVARINMSHGTHDDHAQTIRNVREASRKTGYEVGVLLDLQGPKIRVDKLPEPLVLNKGEKWFIGKSKDIDFKHLQKNKMIPSFYENLVEDSHVGCRILFDDGLLEAKALNKNKGFLEVEIIEGGTLKSNKGINLPDCNVSAPSFTEKDREDLMFGLRNSVDYIALSFVRTAEDIKEVKALLHSLKVDTPIISKIEKPEAVRNIDKILDVTDIIMIARGDMGVELGNEVVPSIQKKLISLCNERGIPVITATQMLESMMENSRPTRAEASDVANAIWDGTDAVMLSGETAAGKYPVETVKMMDQIVVEAEKVPKTRPLLRNMDLNNVAASIQVSASLIAEKTNAAWVIVVTESGASCQKISRFRPQNKVLGVTRSLKTVRRMCLYWGITPYLFEQDSEIDNLEYQMIERLREEKTIANGDKIVISKGDGKFFSRGSSNTIRVEIVKDEPKVAGTDHELQEESWDKGKILLDTSMCASCQNCIRVCPHDIWLAHDGGVGSTFINSQYVSKCSLDMECVESCPTGAIEILQNPS